MYEPIIHEDENVIELFFSKEFEPLSKIPKENSSGVVQYFIAHRVKAFHLAGYSDKHIRIQVYKHLGIFMKKYISGAVYDKTIDNCFDKSLDMQKRGLNTRPDTVIRHPDGTKSFKFGMKAKKKISVTAISKTQIVKSADSPEVEDG